MNKPRLIQHTKDKSDCSAGGQQSAGCESLTKQFTGDGKPSPFLLPNKPLKPAPRPNGNKTCDISRKYTPKKKPVEIATLSRSILYNLRFKAGDILGGRTSKCGCAAGWDQLNGIAIMQKENNFYISGVETCGSVWNCPVCALKISQKRAEQVREILTWSQTRETFAHGFLTLTTRHNVQENCKDVKKRVLDAWRKVTQMRKYKEFGLETIRALEVKYNLKNGWHPHLHIALIAEHSESALKDFVHDFIIPTYLRLVGCETMAANQRYKPIWAGNGVSDYITKWDLSLELTHAESKTDFSNSFSPFGMLKELNKPAPEIRDIEAKHLRPIDQQNDLDTFHLRLVLEHAFKEYSTAFKGSKQLTISRKLKAKFKEFDLLTDEEIANEKQEESEVKLKLSKELFHEIAANRVQADVINSYQIGGVALVQIQLLEFGIDSIFDPDENTLNSTNKFTGWRELDRNYKFLPDKPPQQGIIKLEFD